MSTPSSNAIVLLREEHKRIRALFRQFLKKDTTDARKARLVEQMIEQITVHTYIENEGMYPRVRELPPQREHDILESYEEHHVADVTTMEVYAMIPQDERFEAKTTVLIENVTHHMDEEEQDWFPKVRHGLGRTQLQQLGQELIEARRDAPRQPVQLSALKKTIDAVLS